MGYIAIVTMPSHHDHDNPKLGCMDTSAFNYDSSATVPYNTWCTYSGY